nr:MAG TPA: hypothetical protein [Caudoviricetes sp.]
MKGGGGEHDLPCAKSCAKRRQNMGTGVYAI